jgi:hypothetical protein
VFEQDPASVSRSVWAKIKRIDAVFKTKLNQAVNRDQVVCESLQQCFDVLARDTIEKGEDFKSRVLRSEIQNSLLEIAIRLGWLPSPMAPDRIVWGHREWLMSLLEGRIAYFESCEFVEPLEGIETLGYVIRKVPETNRVYQSEEALEALKQKFSHAPKPFQTKTIKIHAAYSYGVGPEEVTNEQFYETVDALMRKHGSVVILEDQPMIRPHDETSLAAGLATPAQREVPPAPEPASATRAGPEILMQPTMAGAPTQRDSGFAESAQSNLPVVGQPATFAKRDEAKTDGSKPSNSEDAQQDTETRERKRLDLVELGREARDRVRATELQSTADLQRALEDKWAYLRDYQSAQYRVGMDFFYEPIRVYTEAVFSIVTTEYFNAITGADFVSVLKGKLVPEILDSAEEGWRVAVENSLQAANFRFAIIPGRPGWNRAGALGIDFSTQLRAALQPKVNEWEKRSLNRCLEPPSKVTGIEGPEQPDTEDMANHGRSRDEGQRAEAQPIPKWTEGLSDEESIAVPESEVKRRHEAGGNSDRLGAKYAPRYMHHATKPPVMVYSDQEESNLGPEWSREYMHQSYPSWRRHWTKDARIVNDADEDAALGGGWGESPEEFAPYKGPRPARSDKHDPSKWIYEWPVPGLTEEHRNKIKAALLRADATFWRSPDAPSADLEAMRHAFKGIAQVVFKAGILTEQLLRGEIQQLVWDSAIAGGWYRRSSETYQRIFPEQLGHYYVWRDERINWKDLFHSEIGECLADLLASDPLTSPAPGERRVAGGSSDKISRRPVRRNPKYESIDSALREIAAIRPKDQKEVFQNLDGRAKVPNAEPFNSAKGWLAGFKRDEDTARAWLSKAWSRLSLPPFVRGPKK